MIQEKRTTFSNSNSVYFVFVKDGFAPKLRVESLKTYGSV